VKVAAWAAETSAVSASPRSAGGSAADARRTADAKWVTANRAGRLAVDGAHESEHSDGALDRSSRGRRRRGGATRVAGRDAHAQRPPCVGGGGGVTPPRRVRPPGCSSRLARHTVPRSTRSSSATPLHDPGRRAQRLTHLFRAGDLRRRLHAGGAGEAVARRRQPDLSGSQPSSARASQTSPSSRRRRRRVRRVPRSESRSPRDSRRRCRR
jgi:hypothetical protein